MVLDPNFKIIRIKLNNSGIPGRDRHTRLSFLGFFEAFLRGAIPLSIQAMITCFSPRGIYLRFNAIGPISNKIR
jgi:hypothetical protein